MMRMSLNDEQRPRITVKCESFLFVHLYLLLFTFAGVYGQAEKEPKKPSTVQELYNTSSCIPKPYICPHPMIQYYLYTRRTQYNPELIDTLRPESLYKSQFNRAHATKIVIHGFGGGRNLSPSTDMREAYFYRGNYNIFIVDYGTLVKEPCLKQMEWAPRFCALCVAHLVRYLTQHPRGTRADRLHLIGYSVGAHISGLVANYLESHIDGKLGRITGLDPTIVFYSGQNKSRDLDPSDAHFVDILHTNSGILGQWGPNGHADFYINGGSSQPGCASDTLFKTLACDHTKVTPYFIESIITPRGFWAYPCPTLISYLLRICNPDEEEYVLMGEHVSNRARGIYYVTTNAEAPFAQGHPLKVDRETLRRKNPNYI
ncbi:PREDICTED: pancreatic lipase-related protein 2 [Nicrophorus vespilloides]|uniref:Pancreatic lipase-related protein 2 n=1 Tax=Nicrophorus vespilloides TaxID=110193 RepID=A0ABM1N0T6_NICVS|nr:PREDICTED: pancreatic lipase-related protein 2 [Nicrophorus vespilloides]